MLTLTDACSLTSVCPQQRAPHRRCLLVLVQEVQCHDPTTHARRHEAGGRVDVDAAQGGLRAHASFQCEGAGGQRAESGEQ